MAHDVDTSPARGALPSLDFDPESVFMREPGVLLDPKFLAALHTQIGRELGEAAAVTLVQIGFLQGLRDATRVIGRSFASGAGAASSAPLAIRLQTRSDAEPRGPLELHGSWPEGSEASARSGRTGGAEEPAPCSVSAGYTSGWLSGLLEADVLALETRCSARGSAGCHFVAREAEAWRALGCPEASALLDALPYQAFRDLVRSRPLESQALELAGLDPDAAVVHIWGPLMVIPFGGADEALRAVELIGRDAGARDVSVVVLDLAGAIVDETFGAVALEQILATIEAWGAEAVFAGVGPLSVPAVADLTRPPLLVCKDLAEAIAKGLQIAASQRRLV